ncbi:hypothetical protein UA08_09180 [Talaromyces atroroseus]|uniref:DUF1446-domain-containing protein n=1 Tax=Talaromyces atroroseus TaxID=1441469 RepID=A0A1Q5Q6T7_TALAT|nr:hypothetical protein UA08_09180 [Talaromyces atroroseus]OKL55559.1 hypothetical protein UA08_09180 [Talaromyces atroroseus]
MKDELRILTPIGMLGYGFSEELFWSALDDGVDAVILDSGSTDSGPSKLALGTTTVSRKSYERDLSVLVAACHYYNVPLLIGSAGGDGASPHVDLLVDIIEACIAREGYRTMEIVRIYAEVDKDIVTRNWKDGLVTPCTPAVPELQIADINDATRIVAQMGMEPYLKAMNENPNFDIIIGGRAYDPAPYAAFCVWKGFSDLGIAYHMGKIMECGALCAKPKSKEALAIVRRDSFDIRPLDLKARCTKISVAAHTLYEKSRPDILLGPGGALDLTPATYEELPDQRTVRVRGSIFIPESQYTIKLEAARLKGYRSAFIGGFRDPILVSQIEDFIQRGEKRLNEMISFPFKFEVHIYGKGAVMKSLEPNTNTTPNEVCVVGEAWAETQEQAAYVTSMARVWCMHGPYPNQIATSGNFAMPFSPFDIPLGPYSEFCMYHIMPVSDPTSLFAVTVHSVIGSNTAKARNPSATPSKTENNATNGVKKITPPKPSSTTNVLGQPPSSKFVYLGSLASVLRSKNAGPYETTFDIMFPDRATYEQVKESNVLTSEAISRLYSIPPEDVLVSMWWEPALAYKATIKRPTVSASFGEADTHGSAQHAPLMYLQVPKPQPKGAT